MKNHSINSWSDLGQRISEARRAKGLSQAKLGEDLSLDRSAVSRIESGDRGVDTLELATIARVLERPIDWFVLSEPTAVVSRRDANANASVLDQEETLDGLARDVQFLVDLKLLEAKGPKRQPTSFRSLTEAEDLATWARKTTRCDGPLRELAPAVGSLGLLAFSLPASTTTMVGAYVSLGDLGVALVNGAMPTGKRRFALAHELGHHLLLDDFDSLSEVVSGRAQRERLVDAFAIHFLLPRKAVESRWRRLAGAVPDHRMAAITIAAEFGASWSAVVPHLKNLGLIGEAERARLADSRPSKGEFLDRGLGLFDDLQPPSLPMPFASAVVKAFRKHKISAPRAIEMMRGVLSEEDLPRPDHIPLEALSGSWESS